MPWGPTLATVQIPQAEAEKTWLTVSADVSKVTDVHALWLLFYCKDKKTD